MRKMLIRSDTHASTVLMAVFTGEPESAGYFLDFACPLIRIDGEGKFRANQLTLVNQG